MFSSLMGWLVAEWDGWSAPQALVTVHLEGAQGLEKQGLTGKGACMCVQFSNGMAGG